MDNGYDFIENITASEGEFYEGGSFTDDVLDSIEHIRVSLSRDTSPEAVSFLESEDLEYYDAYELATELVRCDAAKKMPRELFDLIVSLYKIAIECKNADAMNDLGALYYDGRGCEQDFTKAVYYYDMAAKNGSREAQSNLGYCYYYGRNVPADYEKAFNYFSLGAFDGNLISLYKIGDMYQNGYYVEKNEKEAFIIYIRCLNSMTQEAAGLVGGPVCLRLGNAFLYGRGTQRDPLKALAAFQKAEFFLYRMVCEGDRMYKKSLESAIEGQKKAREMLSEDIPPMDWEYDDQDSSK